MIRTALALAAALTVAAEVAGAHEGVRNPAVERRMDAMSAIGEATKTLGVMAKGEAAFDAAEVRAALDRIAREAARTPQLFAQREDDPKSEARADIWVSFADFTRKSDALVDTAERLAGTVRSPEDLRPALAALGETCRACHGAYREK